MKKALFFLGIFSLLIACSSQKPGNQNDSFSPEKQLTLLTQKAITFLDVVEIDSMNIPRSLNEDGSIHGVNSRDWTSGFYAGTLWGLYRFSKEEKLKEAAEKWTAFQKKERFDDHTHDLGFKIYCSYGEGYKIHPNEEYKQVIIDASKQLIQRYSDKVAAIRSWDFAKDKWDYPVIIDNMMNLEMLFVATELSGNDIYHKIADNHAETTRLNHFREDHSSYHVIDYFPETGKVRKRNTHQGYNDSSAWARGQAWGLYGFTLSYRATKNPKYLEKAAQIADYFFTHPNLPEDKIPYWDFNAPNIPNEERDASAAAVAASGLIELSQYDIENTAKYLKWADQVLTSLSSKNYEATTPPFFLNQSVGHKPNNSEINVPINYADYYFVEALLRRNELIKKGSLAELLAVPNKPSKKTQALLLTQPLEFDPTDKNKVTGSYVAQQQLTIPNNLATQSRWIMFEGPVLENDVIAYRYYADSRHRFDIYAKSVPDLVMDTVGWDYHNIMDWGSDVLKVGNSLGIGSPAIWYQGTLHTLSKAAKKEISIIENKDYQSIIRTTFIDLEIGNQKMDLIQDWSLAAGQPHANIHLKITKGSLPKEAYFATGIVKHIDKVQTGLADQDFYAYTWGKQSFHKDYLGLAIFADNSLQPTSVEDDDTHAFIFKDATNEVRYAFMAAWEKGNSQVKNEAEFKKLVEVYAN